MQTNNQRQKMQTGSTVRVAMYSIAAGGIVYGETGKIVKLFAAVALVDFGNGNIKKIHTGCLCVL